MIDCYKVLGLKRGATLVEIKKVHRKLVVDLHPDKGGDPDKFREVQEAYDILSDPEKKAFYDKYGVNNESQLVDLFGKLIQECIGEGANAASLVDHLGLKIERNVKVLTERAEKIARFKNTLTESLGHIKIDEKGDDLVTLGIQANLVQVNLELTQAENHVAIMGAAESVMEHYDTDDEEALTRFKLNFVNVAQRPPVW